MTYEQDMLVIKLCDYLSYNKTQQLCRIGCSKASNKITGLLCQKEQPSKQIKTIRGEP